MGDKGLDVLEQYDFNVEKTVRGRGVIIVYTDKGLFTMKSYTGSGRHINFIQPMLEKINDSGKLEVDTYAANKEGSYISTSADGTRYILKRWYECRECDIKSVTDIAASVNALALLHNELDQCGAVTPDYKGADIKQEMIKHNNEIYRAWKFLSKRNNRNEFEQLAYSFCQQFITEGNEAINEMEHCKVAEKQELRLCHGNYNYHNILWDEKTPVIVNFEKMNAGLQMSDFCNIVRKLMEKYDWDIKLGYMLIGEYDKVRRLSVEDIELLSCMLSYPEKFWKIINAYYNSPKTWIPAKNCDKLKKLAEQNEKRMRFIKTLR